MRVGPIQWHTGIMTALYPSWTTRSREIGWEHRELIQIFAEYHMLNCYLQHCNMTFDRRIMSSEHMLLDHWHMKLMMNVSFVQDFEFQVGHFC